MFEPRDLDARPYSKEEVRIVEYLHQIAPDIGGGDDPVGFLMASHNYLIRERRAKRQASKNPGRMSIMPGLSDKL